MWRSDQVVKVCSEATDVDLEVVFDYETAHANVQVDGLEDRTSLDQALPPAMPSNWATKPRLLAMDQLEELESVGDGARIHVPALRLYAL